MQENMELQEIDPELFVSCRLCVDNKGIYQIIPSVQEQIKYTFDITVEQFDGLPQLLCRNCTNVLNDYCNIKKKFKERQDTLIRTKFNKIIKASESKEKSIKIENYKTSEKETTESLSDSVNNRVVNVEKKYVKKSNRRRVLSSSSSSGDEFQTEMNKTNTKNRQETKASNWQSNYLKYFVCRYCKRKCDSIKSIKMHISEHKKILKQTKILTKHCKVTLNTFDYQPNFTRQEDIVALDKHNYIQDHNHINYYIRYIQKGQLASSDETSEPHRNETLKSNIHEYPEVISSDEDSSSKFKLKKRLRTVTRNSSTDTIIPMDVENEKDTAARTDIFEDETTSDNDDKIYSEPVSKTAMEFIDDTSTEAPEYISISKKDAVSANENYTLSNQNVKIKTTDYKTITNIISISFNKHLKKVSQNPNKESLQNKEYGNNNLLNRKLLSIGRKVMSKRGIVSLTLLKYLQKKNLKINWVPSNKFGYNTHTGKEMDYVRILTKVRDTEEEDNLAGFQIWNDDFRDKQKIIPSTSSAAKVAPVLDDLKNKMEKIIADANKQSTLRQRLMSKDVVAKLTSKRDQVLGHVIEVNADPQFTTAENTLKDNKTHIMQVLKPTDHVETQSTLLINSQLLNANPVANPKQAPKKKCSLEPTNQKTVISDKAEISKRSIDDCIYIDSDDEEDSPASNVMPIITSTTSLVEGYRNEKQEKSDTIANLENEKIDPLDTEKNTKDTMPKHRIKCKPVSELMPATALNNLNLAQNHNIIKSNGKEVLPYRPPDISTNSSVILYCDPSSNLTNKCILNTNSAYKNRDYVTMNSPSLPNTQTNSPFLYFEKVLDGFSLNILPANSLLHENFICLISFKLDMRQGENAILLYLSLHAYENEFCFRIKDFKQAHILVENISAQWEWEVLKSFQDDNVTKKILGCAQKCNPIIYKHTKEFIMLLKTMQCLVVKET